jgi:hypothetical protein
MGSFSDDLSDRLLNLVINIIKIENNFAKPIPDVTYMVSFFVQGHLQLLIMKKQSWRKQSRFYS